MKKISLFLMILIAVLAYAGTALDQQADQKVIIKPINQQVLTILKKMDRAKAQGDFALFQRLLKQYEALNPAVKSENGPQVIGNGPEPVKSGDDGSTILWGDDVVVDSAWNYQAFSMDTRSDGVIFLAAARESLSSSHYQIYIWYSRNGKTWTRYRRILWGGRNCLNPALKIVEQNDSSYLVLAFNGRQTSSPYENDIWVLRHPFSSANWDVFPVTNASGVNEDNPSLDADDIQYPNGAYLYCAFESGDSIGFIRSIDFGKTWTLRQIIGSGDAHWDYYAPSIAFGWHNASDSFAIGVAWTYRQTTGTPYYRIRFRRNRRYGASGDWLNIVHFGSPPNHLDHRPVLKMTHGTMPSATIIFARRDTVGPDAEDLCNYYTYNSGKSWGHDTLYSGGRYNLLTSLSVDDTPNSYHAFFKGDHDDIRYKAAHYNNFNGAAWSFSKAVSDGGNISDQTYPATAVLDTMAFVCWEDVTNSTRHKLMFDAIWFTGISENTKESANTGIVSLSPNPSSGITKLSYTIKAAGNVKISIYDAAGRLMKNLLNEKKSAGTYSIMVNNQGLSSGIYFVRMETDTRTVTEPMTIVQ